MDVLRLAGVSMLTSISLLLSACAPLPMNGVIVSPWVAPTPSYTPTQPNSPVIPQPSPSPVATAPVSYVEIFMYQGSRQCENNGIALNDMQKQLQMAGVPVTNSSCGTDGRMYASVCGGADGKINIFTIPSNALNNALAQGFMPLSDLPGAQRSTCNAPMPNPATNQSGTVTYPYNDNGNSIPGNYNPSYYWYR